MRSSKMVRERLASRSIELDWDKIILTRSGTAKLPEITDIREQIASWTKAKVSQRRSFLAIGGDHSSAMGTWSGAVSGLGGGQTLGLIWIDAHLDLHNFTSSPSSNIHGMPLAALLGQADEPLKRIYGDGAILDAVDPEDAPAVSTPVSGGIPGQELLKGLHQFSGNQQLVGIEIAEFAPALDRRQKTLKLIGDIIAAVYGPTTTH